MADKTFLDNFTPKQSFVMGIVLTILALGTLGFLFTLKGGGSLDLGKSAKRAAAPAAPTAPAAPSHGGGMAAGEAREVTNDDHIRGADNAKITVIEYSDFECPFCSRHHPTMNQLITDNNDVAWIYRHFPLNSIHPNAQKAAEASECAAEQGKFWEFADLLFESQQLGMARSQLTGYARQVGLNTSKFDECVDSGKYADKVAADAVDGQTAGGTGTPFSVVVAEDGTQIPVSGAVPLAQLQSVIDSLR